ncbi:uncharacterized protein Dyak_GE29016 [Drosophila yakuba]|uniref:Uncharacterized protein n=1 Tax=Drosophila yakuba TaxID=7245 RepID=A0A0R1DX81_DROYA|nr:uncharacterized protein Dyak_GE29016 [Drosophila yakuba]
MLMVEGQALDRLQQLRQHPQREIDLSLPKLDASLNVNGGKSSSTSSTTTTTTSTKGSKSSNTLSLPEVDAGIAINGDESRSKIDLSLPKLDASLNVNGGKSSSTSSTTTTTTSTKGSKSSETLSVPSVDAGISIDGGISGSTSTKTIKITTNNSVAPRSSSTSKTTTTTTTSKTSSVPKTESKYSWSSSSEKKSNPIRLTLPTINAGVAVGGGDSSGSWSKLVKRSTSSDETIANDGSSLSGSIVGAGAGGSWSQRSGFSGDSSSGKGSQDIRIRLARGQTGNNAQSQNSNSWTQSATQGSESLANGAVSADGLNVEGPESSDDATTIQGGSVGVTGQYPYWWGNGRWVGVGARPSWRYGWRPYGSGWGGWNSQY